MHLQDLATRLQLGASGISLQAGGRTGLKFYIDYSQRLSLLPTALSACITFYDTFSTV